MKVKSIFALIFILLIAAFLRFYYLEQIPPGLHGDGASQGYNAFSLLATGKDRYGEPFPILFRSLGSYQPPLYTYLTTIPVLIFGNTVAAANFVSALSGIILVLVSYLFISFIFKEQKKVRLLAIIFALVIAISPWSVLFSRLAVEANLAVTLFALSVLFLAYSVKKNKLFPLGCLLLGLSTHAYYSERLIAVILLPVFTFIFRKTLLKNRISLIIGLVLFLITQIPHLLILSSGAFGRRFDQVSNIGSNFAEVIINNYLVYYSPKNLFFDSDSAIGRTMPSLSVFYGIFILPFIIGLRYLLKSFSYLLSKITLLLFIVTPLPAAFTGDFFYPLRTLDFLWVLSLIISLGLWQMLTVLKRNITRYITSVLFLFYCLISLYISYFILFKYEKGKDYGYSYIKLIDKLSQYHDKKVVIDLARDPGVGVRMAYLLKYSPEKIQEQLIPQLNSPYYSNQVNLEELYTFENIRVKPIDFGLACDKDIIIIGDKLSVSPKQAEDHNLSLLFDVKDISGDPYLFAYSTNPPEKCLK